MTIIIDYGIVIPFCLNIYAGIKYYCLTTVFRKAGGYSKIAESITGVSLKDHRRDFRSDARQIY